MMKSLDTFEKIRKICLSFPETTEADSWGHPNFRAGKKTFATLERIGGRPSIAFRLGPNHVPASARGKFFSTPYGRGLWVSLWADTNLDWKLVSDLLQRSYRGVAIQRMLTELDTSSLTSPKSARVKSRSR